MGDRAEAGTVERLRVSVAPPYDVVIGRGVLADAGAWLPDGGFLRAAVVTTEPVAERHGNALTAGLRRAGLDVHLRVVPDGETAKSLDTLAPLYDWLASIPLGRGDLVVALGGGVVTDLAGYLAATWHRGVAVVHVPTTLLAQVDAAIGGKTGINLAAGKNLVGAFHQPRAVVADIATLATLPARELRAGMAEVVKCGYIRDPGILDIVDRGPVAALDPTGPTVVELVRRAIAVKAAIVAADTHEHGQRALLNYGHTLGHAVEALTGYRDVRHGEAVAIGMAFAAHVGELAGISEPGLAARTTALLGALDLPTTCPPLDTDAVFATMARDKKATDRLRLVLCRRPGDALLVDAPPRPLLERALRAIA